MRVLIRKSWSPYVVGIGIGVLSWFAFATTDKPIGITTAFEYTAGLAEKAATPHVVEPYLQAKAKDGKTPKIDWEWMLVVGVFAGAWFSARLSNDRAERSVPPLWEWRFGPNVSEKARCGFLRWRFDDVRRPLGARLHQRSRHIGSLTTCPVQLDLCDPPFRDRHFRVFPSLWSRGARPCLNHPTSSCSD